MYNYQIRLNSVKTDESAKVNLLSCLKIDYLRARCVYFRPNKSDTPDNFGIPGIPGEALIYFFDGYFGSQANFGILICALRLTHRQQDFVVTSCGRAVAATNATAVLIMISGNDGI